MHTRRLVLTVHEQYTNSTFFLKALSEATNLSSKHVGRLFKKATGLRFRQYLHDLRMQHAARLLSTSTDEVKIIAATVGYKNVSHFREDFRYLNGCSPTAFRDKELRSHIAEHHNSHNYNDAVAGGVSVFPEQKLLFPD